MEESLTFVDLIDMSVSFIFAVGVFFVFGRIAPNLKVAVFLYAIPNIIFICDVYSPYVQFASAPIYFGADLALALTWGVLTVGDHHVKEGCAVTTNNALEEANFRYPSFHQHCIDVFRY